MSDAPRIEYRLRADTIPEAERSALTPVYRFILDCHKKKEAAPESRPDAGKEINERSGDNIIQGER